MRHLHSNQVVLFSILFIVADILNNVKHIENEVSGFMLFVDDI